MTRQTDPGRDPTTNLNDNVLEPMVLFGRPLPQNDSYEQLEADINSIRKRLEDLTSKVKAALGK
ncbi:hypothetical protein [Hyphomicrobium sp. DY-1]|uniref:hypothetical protein n=1 Tax=Hyphomicrobium sp. DY-1 TaxID=3075650 RepID=UPI0039C3CC6A